MPEIPVNYLAVLLAAVASMVLGFIWYGPLFGKPWMKMMGFTKESMDAAKKKGMTTSYLLMVLSSLVMAYVLAHVYAFASAFMKADGIHVGLSTAFWNWLGFVATVTLGKVLWEQKPWKLWALDSGYYLVSMAIMGMIIAAL